MFRYLLLAITTLLLYACGKDDTASLLPEDSILEEYTITSVEKGPDLGSPPRGNRCYSISLDEDDIKDLKFCWEKIVSPGGIDTERRYIEVLNETLEFSCIETSDTLYTCVAPDSHPLIDFHTTYYSAAEVHTCPEDGEMTTDSYENTTIPGIHDSATGHAQDTEYTYHEYLLLSQSDMTTNPTETFMIDRPLWNGLEEMYMQFIMGEDQRPGWIKVTGSFVHEVGLKKL